MLPPDLIDIPTRVRGVVVCALLVIAAFLGLGSLAAMYRAQRDQARAELAAARKVAEVQRRIYEANLDAAKASLKATDKATAEQIERLKATAPKTDAEVLDWLRGSR